MFTGKSCQFGTASNKSFPALLELTGRLPRIPKNTSYERRWAFAYGQLNEFWWIPDRVGVVWAMTGLETRSVSRDSLFLLANVRVEQASDQYRVRVRNLSDGGMMGEGTMRVQRGNRVEVELRNIGKINGSVAWVQDQRFGIAFDEEVDSQRARKPESETMDKGAAVSALSYAHRAPRAPEAATLRKV